MHVEKTVQRMDHDTKISRRLALLGTQAVADLETEQTSGQKLSTNKITKKTLVKAHKI